MDEVRVVLRELGLFEAQRTRLNVFASRLDLLAEKGDGLLLPLVYLLFRLGPDFHLDAGRR